MRVIFRYRTTGGQLAYFPNASCVPSAGDLVRIPDLVTGELVLYSVEQRIFSFTKNLDLPEFVDVLLKE